MSIIDACDNPQRIDVSKPLETVSGIPVVYMGSLDRPWQRSAMYFVKIEGVDLNVACDPYGNVYSRNPKNPHWKIRNKQATCPDDAKQPAPVTDQYEHIMSLKATIKSQGQTIGTLHKEIDELRVAALAAGRTADRRLDDNTTLFQENSRLKQTLKDIRSAAEAIVSTAK